MTPRIQGILLMMTAMVVFTMLDATAKYVMLLALPPPVAVFFRYLLAFLLSVLIIARMGGFSLMRTRHPVLQSVRGLTLLLSTVFNFTALSHLQLAQTAAIFFTVPLWVCALSGPLLGEPVGLRRWMAVIFGFAGVLIIMRPGTGSFHWAMMLSIASALCGSIYNILTRKVGSLDRAETSLFYVGLAGCLGAALPLPWAWQTPQGFTWVLLIFMGVTGAIGQLLLIEAHRKAPAALLAPFVYTQIVWMILVGFLLFGDMPDHWTLVGALIVVASGLAVIARERSVRRTAD
jgi:drug/metabolite transporter (DMT)-like permease